MITDLGKEIIAKYMLGFVPAYATHIAIGCGSKPQLPGATYSIPSDKEVMDFEMTRLPISSRGFVRDNGTEYLVFGAEVPTENRYEITEVSLWSSGSNSNAIGFDSRNILLFSGDENWQHHTTTSITTIPFISETLGSPSQPYDILDQGTKVFSANANNEAMLSPIRRDRYEGARFLNHSIFMRGDSSNIDSSFAIASGAEHIHLDGYPINLVQNSPLDKLKLSLSVVSATETTTAEPDYVRIVVEFLESELINTAGKATMTHEIKSSDFDGRYFVIEKDIADLTFSANFSWSNVRLVRIHASVIVSGSPSDDYYVVLDAMRLDNVNTQNPLHVMAGYAVVETSDERPIVKLENTSNIIEFRIPIGDTV